MAKPDILPIQKGLAMQIAHKGALGQKGANKLFDHYGALLICIRYSLDGQKNRISDPLDGNLSSNHV